MAQGEGRIQRWTPNYTGNGRVIFGSVCSGIEAASVAWNPLGWKAAFFSEIEKFPCNVLKHHYPETPNFGDMTKYKEWPYANIDVLIGGTPCQSFSVAGLRKGLDDPRGNLTLTYLSIARRYQPRFIVWENVPGVLSANGGRDFGAFLGGLGECGYHDVAYAVLDAQYWGVPQRRRRVFVVGCLGTGNCAGAILFDEASLRGNSPPRREARKGVASNVAYGVSQNLGFENERIGAVMYTLTASDRHAIAFNYKVSATSGSMGESEITAPTLRAEMCMAVQQDMQIRRLTPLECERLQGFPAIKKGYTNIPGASDTARYHALGNSMAVPVIRWIGERIQMCELITAAEDSSCCAP